MSILKHFGISILFATSTLFAQTLVPYQLSEDAPANAVRYSTKPIISISASGHWVALDKSNPVAGFSFSEIGCFKAGALGPKSEGECSENAANIIPNVGFQVSADHNIFEIVSWRADGLTARYVGGACHVAHTLEVDFKTGGVLITDSPTKTGGSALCPTGSYTYRLMEGDAFVFKK